MTPDRVTIIRPDNMVAVNEVWRRVDCSSLPPNFHALQWYGDHGEVELLGRPKPPNQEITSLEEYQPILDAWEAAGA